MEKVEQDLISEGYMEEIEEKFGREDETSAAERAFAADLLIRERLTNDRLEEQVVYMMYREPKD